MAKYISNNAGTLQEVQPVNASAGASDAAKIVETDSTGRIDSTLMPTGLGADTSSISATEALGAGDFVNIYDDAGTGKVRLADSSNDRQAHGFVKVAVNSGEDATVYFEGVNNAKSSMTPGEIQYLSSAGDTVGTAPTTSGYIVQRLGVARSATEMSTEMAQPIVLA